jgi:hypothetical protein
MGPFPEICYRVRAAGKINDLHAATALRIGRGQGLTGFPDKVKTEDGVVVDDGLPCLLHERNIKGTPQYKGKRHVVVRAFRMHSLADPKLDLIAGQPAFCVDKVEKGK